MGTINWTIWDWRITLLVCEHERVLYLVWCCDLAKSFEAFIFADLFFVLTWFKLVFLYVREDILKLNFWLMLPALGTISDCLISLNERLNLIIILWHSNNLCLTSGWVSLRKTVNLPLETVNGQGLRSSNFEHSFDMDNELVEVRVVWFELFKSFMLVDFKHLLFNPDTSSFVFFSFLDQILSNHVLKTWFRLDLSNLFQTPHDYVFEQVFSRYAFLVSTWVKIFSLEMSWQFHNVIERECSVLHNSFLLESKELSSELFMSW